MVQRFDLENVGCAERIWRQAEELARRGHEVSLVQFPHAERRASIPPLRNENPPGVRLLNLDRNAASMARNTRILSNEIQSANLVHLWKCYPDTALPVLWGLRKHPRPLHYDWDDLEGGPGGIAHRMTGSLRVASLVAAWEREILVWADSATAASTEIRRRCLALGFPEEAIFPGPVGAALRPLDPATLERWKAELGDARILSFVGQMEAEDFPVEVLQGVAEVLRDKGDLVMLLVGDGAGRRSLQEEAERLGVSDRCRFTGYLPHAEVQTLLSLSSAFLFPLRDDEMSRCKSPLVVIEALSHGTPVVGSNVGEVPAMVGDCGVLVEGSEPPAWREGVRRLLERVTTDLDLRLRTRERFDCNWTWARSVDNLEKAYHHSLAHWK